MERLAAHGARLLARPIRQGGPPALVVGTARSGTSFFGATLGGAPNAAYLREPVTFEVFRRHPDLVPALASTEPHPGLEKLVDRAFSGRQHRARTVTLWPSQFRSAEADRLVVKEVLPMSATWIARRTGAQVVFIHRHPAAVLASWFRREWYGSPIEVQFEHLLDRSGVGTAPAARLAAIFAIHERAMLTSDDDLGDRARTVTYEDLATEPVDAFRRASDHLGLVWSDAQEREVVAATDGTLERDDGLSADLVRRAVDRVDAWRHELDADVRADAARGYRALGGSLYGDAW